MPHIGHAYEAIATDAIARFERLDGKDVFFLTGTDEHGLKMKQTAETGRHHARELADRNAASFIDMAQVLGLSNDDFIRTTEARHYEACAELWRRMEKRRRYLSSGRYGGWYSVRDEAYYKRSETEVGEDGVRREPIGTPVEWNEEETYFFRLSAYQDKLLAHYEANPEFVLPPRAAQRSRQLRQDAVSRTCRFRARRSTGASRCPARRARHVCLDRRAQQLRDGDGLSRCRRPASRATGRPTCTSSARTSSAFTPFTGRPS